MATCTHEEVTSYGRGWECCACRKRVLSLAFPFTIEDFPAMTTPTQPHPATPPAAMGAVELCEQIALKHHAEEGSYAAGKKAGALECAEAIKRLSAAPTAAGEVADLLRDVRPYVARAYECAFPDESKNQRVLAAIDAALATTQEPSA